MLLRYASKLCHYLSSSTVYRVLGTAGSLGQTSGLLIRATLAFPKTRSGASILLAGCGNWDRGVWGEGKYGGGTKEEHGSGRYYFVAGGGVRVPTGFITLGRGRVSYIRNNNVISRVYCTFNQVFHDACCSG